jgi:long-subunit fatty acid transport protein
MKGKVGMRLPATICVVSFCLLLSVSQICAQPLVRVEIPSSPNPVGSGARALGMGGAFIAIADDATAASWNPGGLIQLEKPEISVVGGYVNRVENNTFQNNPEASGKQSIANYNLNYLSTAYPFRAADRNMIVSLNYQRLYDFNRNWNFNLSMNDPLFTTPVAYQYEQTGALYALGLAYSAEVTPTLSAGVTLNYWGDFINTNKWQQKYSQIGNIDLGGFPGNFNAGKIETYGFSGWNANLGFLWKMTEHWTLGGVFKTPFTASIDHEVSEDYTVTYPTFPAANTHTVTNTKYSEELRMPMSYGLGLAYRFSDNLTISGDLYRTHWDDFMYKNYQGIKTSPISGKPEGSFDIAKTTCLRLGGEYLVIGDKYVVPLRAGIFYDPAPADGSPDNYYGFSLGSGIAYGRFIFDIAYQFRFGNGVGATQMPDLKFSQDVREHTIYTSLIIHF